MKNVKMFKLSLILVLALFASLFLVNTNVNAEEKETFNYVSFGASNVNGYGLDGYLPEGTTAQNKYDANVFGYERSPEGSYPQLITEYFSEEYDVNHHQLGISSMRVEELRVLLDNSYEGDDYTSWRFTGGTNWFLNAEPGGLDALRAAYQEHTANADLITLDIGINNFGVFLGNNLITSGDKVFDMANISPEIGEYYAVAKEYVKELMVASGISEEVLETVESFDHSIDICAYALAGYCYNFDIVVDIIYELNPDVELVVVSIQNIMHGLEIKLPGIEDPISLNNITGGLVNAANFYISGLSRHADKYIFADVRSEGHVEFFADQMAAWDGESELDSDIIDCFNIYDDDLYIKDVVINYFNSQPPYTWDNIGAMFGPSKQEELLNAAYYPIAKIMQAGLNVTLIDLEGYASANVGKLEGALLNKIFGELEESVLTVVNNTLAGTNYVYEFDEEEFFTVEGIDESVVKTVAALAIRTSIGNSFFSHPNRQGHMELFEIIVDAIDNESKGKDYAKVTVMETLAELYVMAEKYGPAAIEFIYGKLEEKGIIEAINNEIISIQNQIIDFHAAVQSQTIAQLEAVKAYLENKLESLKANPVETVKETVAEIEWAIASIDAQIDDAKVALEKAEKALAPVVDALVDLVEYLAAKPEVQEAAAQILAHIENVVNAYVEANIDLDAVVEALNEAHEAAMVIEAKVKELVAEAKVVKAEIEAVLAMAHEKAVEIYGEAKAAAMAAKAAALVEIENAYAKALAIYAEILDAATIAEAEALVEIEAIANEVIEVITGVKADIRSEIENVKADIESYVAALEAHVLEKAQEIYDTIYMAYELSTNSYFATDEDCYYVALGDSSAEGESYVDSVAEGMYIANYENLAVKGMRLEDVYYMLNDVEGDAYYQANFAGMKEEYVDAISSACLVSLSFNNLDFVLAQFGSLEPAELDWSQFLAPEVIAVVEALLAEADGELEETLGEYKAIAMNILTSLVYNYVGSIYYYGQVINSIYEINPEASIVSVGMYNPFAGVTFDYEGTTVNVGEYYDYLIAVINEYHLIDSMMNYSNALVIEVTGVETEFNAIVNESGLEVSITDVVTQLFTNADVFLPSEDGHETIANAVLDAIVVECLHCPEADDHDCTTPVVCILCGEVLEEGAEEHTEVVIPAVAATCTKAGSTQGSMCSVCGTILVAPEEVAKLDHVYENQCDNECDICGASNENLGDHVYSNRCDDTCNICGGLRRVLGHVFGEWAVAVESTKHEAGKEGRVCKECGYVEYRALPLAKGIGAGAVVAIVGGSTVVAAAGGFSVVWFGVKKRKFSDLKKIFKK